MEARLIVVGGKTNKDAVDLKLPTTIGRSREAGITVAHPMISRQHCELSESGGMITLRDLGSLNGTVVGGQKVKEAVLKPSEEFTVGPLRFRVEYVYEGELSDVPPPTLAEQVEEPAEPAVEVPDFTAAEAEEAGEAAADDIAEAEAPVFAGGEETPSMPEGEGPEAPAAVVAPDEEAEAEIDSFEEAIREVTTAEPDAPAEPAPEIVLQPEESEGPEVAEEEEPGPVDLEGLQEVPDLSFMDEKEPAVPPAEPQEEAVVPADELTMEGQGFPTAEEDEFVEVEVVEEEEPEPEPPPGLAVAQGAPAAGDQPAPAQAPPQPQAADAPDFSALSEADAEESDSGEAGDAALNDFLKGLQ